ncbi:MAG: ABC transporter permease subunit [Clostridia bacterium]|nr:ABC transporter permease subunit [Clostridia bacterium]MBQ6359097.1 ABC transporter permease subunit [Clostridia bacterium]MBQ7755578.1 ABC transporter permease subunit [Clostridia bacterium]MBQ9923891.1 ABC transporter permease subunit [Clostridia bacterium]MBR0422859.1 ABC transporter permease subunit [Clostridia bacterium]
MALDMHLLLVTPLEVVRRLFTLVGESGFWKTLLFSFSRIVLGFLLAFALGCLLGVLSGKWPLLETLLWPYVITIKTVPVASFIIISLIFFSARQLSTFISFLMVFPVIYSNVLEGIRSTDRELMEMAQVFRIGWWRRLGYIYLPHLKPFLFSACSVALGMSWKSGVAAEVIGVAAGSIGEKLYESKIYFLTEDLLAWTVVIVLVSVLFEKLFLRLMQAAFDRWEGR